MTRFFTFEENGIEIHYCSYNRWGRARSMFAIGTFRSFVQRQWKIVPSFCGWSVVIFWRIVLTNETKPSRGKRRFQLSLPRRVRA